MDGSKGEKLTVENRNGTVIYRLTFRRKRETLPIDDDIPYVRAVSKSPAKVIANRLMKGNAGQILVETIKGVEQESKVDGVNIIRIKARIPKDRVELWAFNLCLEELNVGIL